MKLQSVTPAKAGVQVSNMFKKWSKAWIPAFAGMTTHPLWAMASRPNADPNAPPPPAWAQFLPIIVMVAVFYFLLIRPPVQTEKRRKTT